jgi:hypothetical protein
MVRATGHAKAQRDAIERNESMTLADAIYQRCIKLPEEAAREALDFIDFLGQRYGTAESLATGGDAASYDAWFRTQVQQALDDTRPGVANEDVREHFARRRQALREKL